MADASTQLLINGELRDAAGATFTTYDPARGIGLATVAKATPFVAFPGVPFGRFKESGYGREQSLDALDLYTKAVLRGTSPKPANPFGV